MPAIPAIIMGGAAIGSTVLQSRAAGRAADTQERGADEALALQRDIYNQQREDLAPFRQAGAGAVGLYAGLQGIPMGAGGGGSLADPMPAPNRQEQAVNTFRGARDAYLGEHGTSLVDRRRAFFAGRDALREASGRTASSYGNNRGSLRGLTGGSFGMAGGLALPQGGSLSAMSQPSIQNTSGANLRMVRMISPTGEEAFIPENEAAELERMGARRA